MLNQVLSGIATHPNTERDYQNRSTSYISQVSFIYNVSTSSSVGILLCLGCILLGATPGLFTVAFCEKQNRRNEMIIQRQ